MTEIVCDICRKVIPNSVRSYSWESRNERYDTILDKDVCPACLDELDGAIRQVMETEDQYTYGGHRETLVSKLEELTG
jgi:hypothetical protein